jgi:hypothetical protein
LQDRATNKVQSDHKAHKVPKAHLAQHQNTNGAVRNCVLETLTAVGDLGLILRDQREKTAKTENLDLADLAGCLENQERAVLGLKLSELLT